jgi:hypothetical protein
MSEEVTRRGILKALAALVAAPALASAATPARPKKFACKECGVLHPKIRLKFRADWLTGGTIIFATARIGARPNRQSYGVAARISGELRDDLVVLDGKDAWAQLLAQAKKELHDRLIVGIADGSLRRRELEEIFIVDLPGLTTWTYKR